jgi:Zn ribbon nucleic-acid-binding protein
MEAYSNLQSEDTRRFTQELSTGTRRMPSAVASGVEAYTPTAAERNQTNRPSPQTTETTMADVRSSPQEIHAGAEVNGEIRPQVPTWSVANAKEALPPSEPEIQTAGTRIDTALSNGSHTASADADAQSDIDELLTGGDADPEPPRYDGDFDIERHDYWWNLLDMENPRHARASKGMRYGAERNPRCDTCERQNRACMTRPNSHDKTGCVRCSYTQSGCSHAREARESHVSLRDVITFVYHN